MRTNEARPAIAPSSSIVDGRALASRVGKAAIVVGGSLYSEPGVQRPPFSSRSFSGVQI
jgi:hypothetical protein